MEVNRSGVHIASFKSDPPSRKDTVSEHRWLFQISREDNVSRRLGVVINQAFEDQEQGFRDKDYIRRIKDDFRIRLSWLRYQPPDSNPVEIRHKPIYEDDDFKVYTYPPILVDGRLTKTLKDFREYGLVCINDVRRSCDGNILRIRSHGRYHLFVNDDGKWKRYIGMDTCPDSLFSDLSYCEDSKRVYLLQRSSAETRELMNEWDRERKLLEKQRFDLCVFQDKALVEDAKSNEVVLNLNKYPIGRITGYVFSHDGSSLLIQAEGKLSLFVRWPYENGCKCKVSDEERGECWKPYLKGMYESELDYDCDFPPYGGVINLHGINCELLCFHENLLNKALSYCEPSTPTTNSSAQWLYLIRLLLECGANPNKECCKISVKEILLPWRDEENTKITYMTPFYTALKYAMAMRTSYMKSARDLLGLLFKYGARLPSGCKAAEPGYEDIYKVAIESIGTFEELPEPFVADVCHCQFISARTLSDAVKGEKYRLLERLVKYGHSVNLEHEEQSLLEVAFYEEKPEMLEWLIKKGANFACVRNKESFLDRFFTIEEWWEDELRCITNASKKECFEMVFRAGYNPMDAGQDDDMVGNYRALVEDEYEDIAPDVISIIAVRFRIPEYFSLKGFAQEAIRKATGYDPDKYHQAISWAYKEQHVVEKLKEPLIPEILNGDYASDQAVIS